MKKLEDFSNELFSLSNKQLSSIKGSETGMGINKPTLSLPWHNTGYEECTDVEGGGQSQDFVQTDFCIQTL